MDTVVLVGRLLVSLAVVLGLLWLVARRSRRRGGGRQSTIEVLGRQQLGRHSAVAVVRVAGQTLILGVTDGAVSLLTTADLEDEPAPAAANVVAPVAEDRGRHAAAAADREAVPAPRSASAAARRRNSARQHPDRSALAGSALSPGTWRQTVDTLRDITARTG